MLGPPEVVPLRSYGRPGLSGSCAVIVAEYEPPPHVTAFLAAHPDGLHADHRDHRRAVVFDGEGRRVSGLVRWLAPKAGLVCVLAVDENGFRVRDDAGQELELEVPAAGWTFRRSVGAELETI